MSESDFEDIVQHFNEPSVPPLPTKYYDDLPRSLFGPARRQRIEAMESAWREAYVKGYQDHALGL